MDVHGLIKAIHDDTGLSQELVKRVLDAMTKKIKQVVADDGIVKIRAFGYFTSRRVAARKRWDGRKAFMRQCPAMRKPVFNAAAVFRKAVREKGAY